MGRNGKGMVLKSGKTGDRTWRCRRRERFIWLGGRGEEKLEFGDRDSRDRDIEKVVFF